MKVNLGALPGNYPNGETFSDVLSYNHYGTETIPPRPVLRIAAENVITQDAAQKKSLLATFLHNIIVNPKDAKTLEQELLRKLGVACVSEAKHMIDGGGELQHNAPRTVAQKGFNKPLFETGQLEKHISYEVTE